MKKSEGKECSGRAREGRPAACRRPGRAHSGATPQTVAAAGRERRRRKRGCLRKFDKERRRETRAPPPSANTHAQQGRSLSQPRHRLSPSCAMNPLSSRLRPLLLEGRDRIRQMEEREVGGGDGHGGERERWYRSGRSLVCQWPKRGGGAGSVCAQQSRARSLLLRLWRARARYSSRSLGVVNAQASGFNREVFFLTTRRLRLFILCSKKKNNEKKKQARK